jgi:hypothetical protein
MYFLLFTILKNSQTEMKNKGIILDSIVFFVLFVTLFFAYFYVSDEMKTTLFVRARDNFFAFLNNPFSIVPVLIFFPIFYLCQPLFGLTNSSSGNSYVIVGTEWILWTLLAVVVMVNFFKFVLLIDVVFFFKQQSAAVTAKPSPLPFNTTMPIVITTPPSYTQQPYENAK